MAMLKVNFFSRESFGNESFTIENENENANCL